MTLRAREQDIRREKAASNICTNQALLALAASVYLATIGPHGLRDVAALGAAHATALEAALAAAGAPRIHAAPYLNELVVRVPDARGRPRPAARPRRARGHPHRRPAARRAVARRRAARVRDRGHHARRDRAVRDRAPAGAGRRGAATHGVTRAGRGRRAMTAVRGDLQPTLFELSHAGRGGGKIPHPPADALDRIPAAARRATPPALPELSEPEVVRHYVNLSHLNYSVDTGFYPLGSCTMKFNPKLNEWAARLPGFAGLHPMAPDAVAQGTLELLFELEAMLAEISGMDAVTLQPAAGRPRRADRDHDDPRLPPVPRRRRAPGGPRPGLVARHQPGDGDHGRLPHDHDPVRARRRRRHRRVQGGARAADRGDHDHQPVDARAVRAADRGAAGRDPRGGRARLHGRREPQRDPRAVQAGRGRLRRHALQHPQDVQHAARRRRPRRRARRREGEPRPVPARAARRPGG